MPVKRNSFAAIVALAQLAAAAPGQTPGTAAPATRPAERPVLQPMTPDFVLARVGRTTITPERIRDVVFLGFGPFLSALSSRVNGLRRAVMREVIFMDLAQAYVDKQQVRASPEEIAAEKRALQAEADRFGSSVAQYMKAMNLTDASIDRHVRVMKVMRARLSEAAVDALIAAHPEYFDGTQVAASHLMKRCDPLASTVEQKQVLGAVRQILADVRAGKITFAQAVAKHSDAQKRLDGAVGMFRFQQQPPDFAVAAFALEPMQVSDVVRTEVGFHLIRVNVRLKGTDKPDPKDENVRRVARAVLAAGFQHEILAQVLADCPLVYTGQE